jgi:hypothetical protein
MHIFGTKYSLVIASYTASDPPRLHATNAHASELGAYSRYTSAVLAVKMYGSLMVSDRDPSSPPQKHDLGFNLFTGVLRRRFCFELVPSVCCKP